jgi:hypothetical protein
MSNPFKCNFNIDDYKDILPPLPSDETKILNIDKPIEEQYWRRIEEPRNSNGEITITPEFVLEEFTRIRQGIWMLNKGVPIWIPGDYYSFLQHWNATGKPPEFRLKRLKSSYHDYVVKKDPNYLGDITFKNRKDGETLYKMCNSFMYPLESGMTHGGIGIQSMDLETIQLSCWAVMKSGVGGLNQYFKDYFLKPLGLVSDKEIQTCIRFERQKDPNIINDYGVGIRIDYKSNKETSYDSASDLRLLNLDEFAKWFDISIEKTLGVYTPIMYPGFERKGLIKMFSSPATTNGRHLDEAKKIWDLSNPNIINPETGTTFSRLKRNYSNPIDGIESSYDKYGDVDPDKIYKFVHSLRNGKTGNDLMAAVRAYPMPIKGSVEPNEDELFGATDNSGISVFMNTDGLKNRLSYVKENKNTLVQYGDLVYPKNIPRSGRPIFIPSDKMEFNDIDSKFCIAFPDLPRKIITDIYNPPQSLDKSIGFDPFSGINKNFDASKESKAVALTYMFNDVYNAGISDVITSCYSARPIHKDLASEDLLKLAWYEGALIQIESSDFGVTEEYFRKTGLENWLLDSYNDKLIKTIYGWVRRKGDAPTGAGAKDYMGNGVKVINGIISASFNEQLNDSLDVLKNFNIEEVLDCLLTFDINNTQKSHYTMALIATLIGRNKMMMMQPQKKYNNARDLIGFLNS